MHVDQHIRCLYFSVLAAIFLFPVQGHHAVHRHATCSFHLTLSRKPLLVAAHRAPDSRLFTSAPQPMIKRACPSVRLMSWPAGSVNVPTCVALPSRTSCTPNPRGRVSGRGVQILRSHVLRAPCLLTAPLSAPASLFTLTQRGRRFPPHPLRSLSCTDQSLPSHCPSHLHAVLSLVHPASSHVHTAAVPARLPAPLPSPEHVRVLGEVTLSHILAIGVPPPTGLLAQWLL